MEGRVENVPWIVLLAFGGVQLSLFSRDYSLPLLSTYQREVSDYSSCVRGDQEDDSFEGRLLRWPQRKKSNWTLLAGKGAELTTKQRCPLAHQERLMARQSHVTQRIETS